MYLLVLGNTAFNTLVVAWLVRRLIGASVGWPRTLLLSLVVGALTPPALNQYSELTGIDYRSGVVPSTAGLLLLAIFLGWLLAIEVAVLTFLEATVPTGPQSLVQRARSIPATYRRWRRMLGILLIAARHGLLPYLRFGRRTSEDQLEYAAQSLYVALSQAGVTFVKLGQLMATRSDLLPEPMIRHLSKLQCEAEPVPWDQIEPVVRAELPLPVDEVFAEIDSTPLAAASVAQVHAARLLDGSSVVVKVQRPGAPEQVAADLDIIRRIGRRLERSAGWARHLGVNALVEGFALSLHQELDYRIEDLNTTMLRATLAPDAAITVPRTYPQWSGKRMLVMTRAQGAPLSIAPGMDPGLQWVMADQLVAMMMRHIMVGGAFHADLHPGNLFVGTHGELTVIDCGSVGRLDGPSRWATGALVLAARHGDCIAATDALINLLDPPVDLDHRALERDVGIMLVQVQATAGSGHSASLYTDLFRLVTRYRLRVPPMVAAMFRALNTLEETVRQLSPGADFVELAATHGPDAHSGAPSAQEIKERLIGQLAIAMPALQRVPRRLDKVVSDLESGNFAVTVRGPNGSDGAGFVTGLVHQVIIALIAATSAVVGIALILFGGGADLTPTVKASTAAGAAFLLFGFVLAARSLAQIFQHAGRVRGQGRAIE